MRKQKSLDQGLAYIPEVNKFIEMLMKKHVEAEASRSIANSKQNLVILSKNQINVWERSKSD